MGGSSSTLSSELTKMLADESGLSKSSIRMLHLRFLLLAKHYDEERAEAYMTPQDFEEIPELLKNPIGSRLIEVFFVDNTAASHTNRVYFRDFVRVFGHFRPVNKHRPDHPWNSREAKLKFAFNMYDSNGSGTITQEEFTEVLERNEKLCGEDMNV